MFSKQFLKDTAERAIKTFAQVVIAMTTLITAGNGTISDVNWAQVLSAAVLAALISVLTSLGSANVNSPDSASLVK